MPKVMLPLSAQPLWLPTENLAAGPWEPVCAPVRLASAAASVSFQSIPAQYVMFRLRCEIIKDASGATVSLRFNNDSGANYDYQRLTGNGATVAGARATGGTSIPMTLSIDASSTTTFGVVIAKPIAGANGLTVSDCVYTATDLTSTYHAGRWANTADLINRIDVINSVGNFAAGSIFYLEGSKF